MSALWNNDASAVDAHTWRPLSSSTQEMLAVAAFAAALDGHGDLRAASMETRLSVLGALHAIAGAVDLSACTVPEHRDDRRALMEPRHGASYGSDHVPAHRYGRRVLLERPNWSLAAITLRDGQETEAHDHDGWGCVVTVQGVERDRRYRSGEEGLVLVSERDYLPGSGYIFDPVDIHQPVGADPGGLTIALHFLVHDAEAGQHHHEQRTHAA